MGTIKDIVDLSTQLSNSVHDRKIATELHQIQLLLLKLQSEQSDLHEDNINLREERLELKEQIRTLHTEIYNLKESSVEGPSGAPTCPNCSTRTKPFYISPVATDFVSILNATHECPKCKYTVKIKE